MKKKVERYICLWTWIGGVVTAISVVFLLVFFTPHFSPPEATADTGTVRYTVIDEEDLVLTSTTTVVQFVSAVSPQAHAVWIGVQGDDIRWKGYTALPEANNGPILSNGDYLIFDTTEIDIFKYFKALLSSGGSGATLHAIYLGR